MPGLRLTARPHHILQSSKKSCDDCNWLFFLCVFYLRVPKHSYPVSVLSSGFDQSTFSEFTILGYKILITRLCTQYDILKRSSNLIIYTTVDNLVVT